MAAFENEDSELGYVFQAFPSGASLGYAGLDVFLTEAGLEKGFAAAQLIVPVWESERTSTKLALTAHWSGADQLRVAPGIIAIQSHGGDKQSVYCFGGTLTCRQDHGLLHCRLDSPAPILNLSEEGMDWSENVVLRVVDSIESEIASLRAHSNGIGGAYKNGTHRDGGIEAGFGARMARTDPRLLYAAGLTLAQHSFAVLPDILRTEHYWDEHNTLKRALQEAQQEAWWPDDPSLPAVLAPARPG